MNELQKKMIIKIIEEHKEKIKKISSLDIDYDKKYNLMEKHLDVIQEIKVILYILDKDEIVEYIKIIKKEEIDPCFKKIFEE